MTWRSSSIAAWPCTLNLRVLGGAQGYDVAPAMEALAELHGIGASGPPGPDVPAGSGSHGAESALPATKKSSGPGSHGAGAKPKAAKAGEPLPREGPPPNALQPLASRVLMKILYAARMARSDLLRAVCGLASNVTKWTRQCDADLYRLVC